MQRTSLSVCSGDVVALIGPSGGGKSTLLGVLAGTILPTSGAVQVLGMDLTTASSAKRSQQRRTALGLIFQDADLLPELNARENVALLMILDGEPRSKALAEAERMLTSVGLQGMGERKPAQLSGGERQRVAISRALARPTASLVLGR